LLVDQWLFFIKDLNFVLSAFTSQVGSDSLQGEKDLFSAVVFERVFPSKASKWEAWG